MTDVPSKSMTNRFTNVLGLRKSAGDDQAPRVMSQDELDEESFVRGWASLKESRVKNERITKERDAALKELEDIKKEYAREMTATQSATYAQIANLKAANESLRSQLDDLGRKHEHILRWSMRMEQRVDNTERTFENGLHTIATAGDQLKLLMMKQMTQVNASLNDAVTAATNSFHEMIDAATTGFGKQLANLVTDMKRCLADMRENKGTRDYRPSDSSSEKKQLDDGMTDEEREKLREFAANKLSPIFNEEPSKEP